MPKQDYSENQTSFAADEPFLEKNVSDPADSNQVKKKVEPAPANQFFNQRTKVLLAIGGFLVASSLGLLGYVAFQAEPQITQPEDFAERQRAQSDIPFQEDIIDLGTKIEATDPTPNSQPLPPVDLELTIQSE